MLAAFDFQLGFLPRRLRFGVGALRMLQRGIAWLHLSQRRTYAIEGIYTGCPDVSRDARASDGPRETAW